MIGENFKHFGGDKLIKEINQKIQSLRDEKAEIESKYRYSNNPLPAKFWKLVKEIEWQEYLLWGAQNKMIEK